MLLQGHTLGDYVALLGLLAPRDLSLDLVIVLYALDLRANQVSAGPHSVHELSLEQVVERV